MLKISILKHVICCALDMKSSQNVYFGRLGLQLVTSLKSGWVIRVRTFLT